MAPIKQEEQMRDKLEKRSLQPSPESWTTLSNRLDAEQKTKNKSLFWWFGIAASIVGIVFVTALYINNQSIKNTTPILVNSNEDTIQRQKDSYIELQKQTSEVAIEQSTLEEKPLNEAVSKSPVKTIASEKNQIQTQLPEQDAVALQVLDKTENEAPLSAVEKNVNEIKKATLTFEAQKIQDVVAQINDLKANGIAVSDTEIENLLNKAQKEILSNRLYNETTRTVDANALLQDVEADLQQSFRSKVFEALQSGYESVRTAVAQRNN